MYEDRNYVIFNVSELDQIHFDHVLETSAETVRKSVDGTKTFVKYDLPLRPSIYSSEYTEYTHHQILEVLGGEEWVVEENVE